MSSKVVFALAAVAALCTESSSFDLHNDPFWRTFKSKYKKTYSNEAEESMRYQIFLDNMQKAAEYNEDSGDAWYGMTPVSDKRKEELFSSIVGMGSGLRDSGVMINRTIRDEDLPDSFDARDLGMVNPVVDQGGCGSCWAFASTATLAASYYRKHKRLLRFSEQQSVDCCGGDGCEGGNFNMVYHMALDHPLMLRDDYPYKGTYSKACLWDSTRGVLKPTGGIFASGQTVESIKEFLVRYGVGFATYCAEKSHGYIGGIMTGSHCSGKINHAVAMVGWGKTSDGRGYWILRNSWGEDWGEHGYFRMEMGTNACRLEQCRLKSAEVE